MQKLVILFTFLPFLVMGQTSKIPAKKRVLLPKTNTSSNIPKISKSKFDMSEAQPEDITNENFPDIIDSFDFQDAELIEVIKAMNKLTGKNIILDNNKIRGKITILAPSQITVAEAYKAFLSALAMNGLTIVPSGKFLKIMNTKDAQNSSIETYTEYFPNTDQMITRIIRLKYINAEQVQSKLSRLIKSKSGDVQAYGPTNSIIITDLGSNIERISRLLDILDVPGFEEQLAVIRIQYAKAKDISNIIDKIINKDKTGRSGSAIRRFRKNNTQTSRSSGAESYSLVVPDERSNSIIVMGNQAGIDRIKKLVGKLDFPLNPEDAGGVYVYYVRHVEAVKVADVLNGIASQSKGTTSSTKTSPPRSSRTQNKKSSSSSLTPRGIFGGSVKITADEVTNSLIVTSSKQDYSIIKNLLSKLDIARDQVFVKTIIMEMNAQKGNQWGVNYFRFDRDSQGLGRAGFSSGNLSDFINPLGGAGAILSFATGETFDIVSPTGGTVTIPNLIGLIHFLKSNVGGNILSQPQVMAVDNEEAVIEVGQEVPVGTINNNTAAGNIQSIERKKATIKLTITPFISPDTDSVMMNIDHQVKQVSRDRVQAAQLADAAITLNERTIKTSIVVDSGNTAVLGGLMQDQESEEVTKVPILGDIPIIGWLFKSRQIDKVKKNLLVFITPKVIRSSQDSSDLLNEKLNERLEFIQKQYHGQDVHEKLIKSLQSPQISQNESPTDDIGEYILDEKEDIEESPTDDIGEYLDEEEDIEEPEYLLEQEEQTF